LLKHSFYDQPAPGNERFLLKRVGIFWDFRGEYRQMVSHKANYL
jgi:hypothetical protein